MRPDRPPSRDGMSSLEALGTVGLAGLGTFVVAVVAMHLIRPDLDPMDRTISEYALGGSGWLMTLAWLALLVAAFVLRGVFARNPGWQDLSLPTRWLTRAMLAMFVARVSVVIVRLPGSAGLVQRILWLFMLAWLVLIGWPLRQLGHSPARTHEPRPVTGR